MIDMKLCDAVYRRRLPARAVALACMAWGIGAAPAAFAQTTLPTVEVTGEPDQGYVVKETTTATKTDTELRDIPQSITVIPKEQVRDQAAQSLGEALRYVPGVGFAQGEGNRETPIFRGFSTTADFFVDGVRDDVQYYRDLYNIERVEVFRGPNAMIFGRGASGGLINRVTKTPKWTPAYGAELTLGSNSNRRATFDVNQPINSDVSFRVSGLYEDSESYRNGVWLERSGINPTLAWRIGPKTLLTLGYEYFKDDRIADRGISSYQGRPVQTARSTFFGNAEGSPTGTELNAVTALFEHTFDNGVLLRNRTRWADQDKFYQNVFPGAVNAAGTQVSISAYNNATDRENLFNQTDVIFSFDTGGIQHKLLLGAELGRQDTNNFRQTGFFPGGGTSVTVPLSNPVTLDPITYGQAPNDADNSGKATTRAFYVQDQLTLSPQWQLIAGLRYDNFEVDFRNNRNGAVVTSDDGLVSPRVGLIYRPVAPLSLYANYSVAYQPRSGEQLASLNLDNAALKPEKFESYEVGAKWDVARNTVATAALYRLDRTNASVLDPADPTRSILSDGQRSEGLELSLAGNLTSAWTAVGGYAYTDAQLVGDTSATLRAGAKIGQVPRHTFSLWNRYDFTPSFGAGIGLIHRAKSLASTELLLTPNANVTLPAYTRVDAALFFRVTKNLQAQLNVENLFDEKYYQYAHSNTNITPGSPRAFRVGLQASF